MTTATSFFADFLENIRLPKELRDQCQNTHRTLAAKLLADDTLRPIIVSIFLQGSYRRHTGTKPTNNDPHADVDVVVVTTLDPTAYTPDRVVERFRPFLEREYPGQWTRNDRSIKISPAGMQVTIDLVPTAAPSEIQREFLESLDPDFQIEARGEADQQPVRLREAFERLQKAAGLERWQREPLLIPSRDLQTWVPTHPLEQIRWTLQKNDLTGGHYVNVVKAIRWWRKQNTDGEHPKAYPLEHFVGETCPDGVVSVAEGVTRAFERMSGDYAGYASTHTVPTLPDRGVPQNDVFRRITPEQFHTFWNLAGTAASAARTALDAETSTESAQRWRSLFGEEFPAPEKPFTPPSEPAQAKTSGRYG